MIGWLTDCTLLRTLICNVFMCSLHFSNFCIFLLFLRLSQFFWCPSIGLNPMRSLCVVWSLVRTKNSLWLAVGFRGTGGRSEQCSVNAWVNKKVLSLDLNTDSVADENWLWQRVPDRRCWKSESTTGKVCPGERLDLQRDGRWSQSSAADTFRGYIEDFWAFNFRLIFSQQIFICFKKENVVTAC